MSDAEGSALDVVGIVPAAGRSTRIGSPKPLLDAGGVTFLDRVTTALREGGVSSTLIGVRDSGGPVHAAALRTGATVFVPDDVELGPIATVRTALHMLSAENATAGILLLPVDMPLVTARTVRALLEAFQAAPDAPLVLPVQGGRDGHPVLFARVLFPELLDPTLEGGARTITRRHRSAARKVPVEDRGIHLDIDSLPDYRRHFPGSYRRRFQKW